MTSNRVERVSNEWDTADADIGTVPSSGQRRSRRLSDKVLVAFHSACDAREFDAARQLLQTLELLVNNPNIPVTNDRRRNVEVLVAAHERLWNLLNPPTMD